MTMRRSRKFNRPEEPSFRLTPMARSVQLALLPGLLFGLNAGSAFAAPTGGAVAMHNGLPAGNATITQNASGSLTTINQSSHRVAIDWQTFNVHQNELVQFIQPSARASALNRIFDQKPSEIFGQIKANGQVVLMNPNGVFFKPGARVNVGSLIAGAMQIGVGDFMSGNYKLEALENAQGRGVNEGRIEAASGGDVTLVGKSIANHGVIVATAGRVNLLAGEQVTVDFDGDGLLKFSVDKAVIDNAVSLDDQISNTGDIIAAGGDVLITASAADGVFKNAINNAGLIKAARIDKSGGRIMLVGMGPGASVMNTGQINASAGTATDSGGSIDFASANITNTGVLRADASGGDAGTIHLESEDATTLGQSSIVSAASSDGGAGGSIQVLGKQVALNYDAAIDVSGTTGGGEALIGGDYKGGNSEVRNAENTFFSVNATITADAGDSGDGGKVVVRADDTTRFYGEISARGGEESGDGGFVEVSGKQTLVFRGDVDTLAPNGEIGTLLLDPGTLTFIDTDGVGPPAAEVGDQDTEIADGTIAFGDADIGANTLSWGAIDALAATTAILAEATGLVTINDVDGSAGGTITSNNLVDLDLTTGSLTITSTTGNVVFADTADVIQTNGGAITINAAAGTANVGGFDTTDGGSSGAVTINSGTDGTIGDVTTGGATLTLNVGAGTMTQVAGTTITGTTVVDKTGAGALTFSEGNDYSGTTTVSAGTLNVSNITGLGTVAAGTTVADGATLNVAGVAIGMEAITVQGTGVGAAGALQASLVSSAIGGGITLLGDTSFGGVGGLALNGVIDDAGSTFAIEKVGLGTVQLGAANTYDGTTTVTAGTLIAADADALGANGGGVGVDGTTVANGAALSVANVTLAAEELAINGTGGGAGALRGTGTAEVQGTVALATASTVGVGTGDTLTISGVVSGANDLTKAGDGTLVLSVANTYSGATTVSAGTLRATHQGALGANGGGIGVDGTTVASDARLEFAIGSSQTVSEELSITGDGPGTSEALLHSTAFTLTLDGGITLGGNATVNVSNGAGIIDVDTAAITDGGSTFGLTKTGPGTLRLSIASTYDGATAVSGGTLQAGTGVVDIIAPSSGLTLSAGTTFDLNDADQSIAQLDSAAANAVVTNSGGAAELDITGGGGDFAGDILDGTGALTVTKSGSGTQILSVDSGTYTGDTNVEGGTLRATTLASFGMGAGETIIDGTNATATLDLQLGASTLAEDITLQNATSAVKLQHSSVAAQTILSGTVNVDATAEIEVTDGGSELVISTGAGSLAGAGPLTKTGAGELTLSTDNSASFTGAISVAAGTLTAEDSGALGDTTATTVAAAWTLLVEVDIGLEAITLNGGKLAGDSGVVGGPVTLLADSAVGGPGTLNIDGIISGVGFGIDKQDAGTVVLNGVNTYTGATTVTLGTLEVTDSAGLGATAVGTTVAAGGTLNINDVDIGTEGLTLDGGKLAGTGGGAVVGGTVALTADSDVGGTGTLNIDGIISGVGFGIDKQDAGIVVINAANTYTGTTTVTLGTLRLGAAERIADGSALVVDGGTFDMNDFSETVATISGAGGVITSAGVATLSGDGASTYAGNITVAVALNKTGSGTLTLSGNNSYTGATTVSSTGTLQAGSITGFSMNSAVTLTGTSTLDANDFTVTVASLTGGTGTLDLGFGSLSAGGDINLTSMTITTTAGSNTIDSTGGTLTTDGFSKTGTGDLSLGGATAIVLNGTITVPTDDLILLDDFTLSSGNLSAGTNVTFQGTGTSNFTQAGAQTVTAGGNITDTAGAILAKTGGTNLILSAGGDIGVSTGNRLGLALTGGSAVQASATGSDVFMESAASLLVLDLTTGPGADTVDILVSGATSDLTMDGGAGYGSVAGDDFTLSAGRDLIFQTNTLTVDMLDASFGQAAAAAVIDLNVVVVGTTTFDITGGSADDTIDVAGLAGPLTFTASGLGMGSISGGLTVDSYTGIDSIIGSGSAGDTFESTDTFVIDGMNSGTAVNALSGTWSSIEKLTGTAGADSFTFDANDAGVLSGDINGLAGANDYDIDGDASVNLIQGGDNVDDVTLLTGVTLTGDVQAGNGADSIFFNGTANQIGFYDGEAGNDTVDFSASTLVQMWSGSQSGEFTGQGADPDLIDNAAGNDWFSASLTDNGLGTTNGPNTVSFWLIRDVNEAERADSLADLLSQTGTWEEFLGILNIVAGNKADTFIFEAVGQIPDGIDGGNVVMVADENTVMGSVGIDLFTVTGTDSLTLTVDFGGAMPLATTLTTIADIDSTAGGAEFTDAGADTIDVTGQTWGGIINGAAASDTLMGSDNYIVTGIDTGTSTNVAGGWSMIENLTGTGGIDTFNFSAGGVLTGNASGLAGADIFNINGAGAGALSLIGGTDSDFDLNSNLFAGAIDGSAGGTDTDILTGSDNYIVTGTDTGTSTDVTGGWSEIENLIGTAAADVFDFGAGGVLTGSADGLAGGDTFNINGAGAGAASLIGGLDSDTFNLNSNLFAGAIDGSAGGTDTDTLTGSNDYH